jgi:S-DNA-T family DNA segregation ATPase FtsK/SpoIIIE
MNFLQTLMHRKKLVKVFDNAGIYKEIGEDKRRIYPKIHRIQDRKKAIQYVFSVPVGVDPGLMKKKFYVFEQIFGESIDLDGGSKTFVLSVKKPRDPNENDDLVYSINEIKKSLHGAKLGVICGADPNGNLISIDLTEQPHILIAGETGSGKSTQIRSIVTTWILTKRPNELELYMGDCKKSEFHIFKRVEHVKCVHTKPKDIERMLNKIKVEMDNRSDLTEMYEVGHIDDLPPEHKKPYIVVCIDEFVLLRNNDDIMAVLIDIVCVGRTLGVFVLLSMQRPNAKTLDTTIRSQCTVSMGFQLRDKIESNMVNTPGAEKIEDSGYFIMNAKKIQSLQAPYLKMDKAKELLNPFYVMKNPVKNVSDPPPPEPKQITEGDVFNDVKTQG